MSEDRVGQSIYYRQSDQAQSGVVSSDWLKTHLELAEWIN